MELNELVAGFGAKTGLGELRSDDEGISRLKCYPPMYLKLRMPL